MIFTQQQILDMLDIMKRYELIFIAQQLGLQFLSQNDIAILLSAGIDVNQFKNTKGDILNYLTFEETLDGKIEGRIHTIDLNQIEKCNRICYNYY